MENGTVVEEGDVEDQKHEVELGKSDYTLLSRKCNKYLQRSMKYVINITGFSCCLFAKVISTAAPSVIIYDLKITT